MKALWTAGSEEQLLFHSPAPPLMFALQQVVFPPNKTQLPREDRRYFNALGFGTSIRTGHEEDRNSLAAVEGLSLYLRSNIKG